MALTEGRSEKPDSSSKMIHAPRSRAFFYHGPTITGPGGDCLLVALECSANWTLARPSETLAKDRPRLGR